MAFTVQDFRDLLTLLDQHPEWREELLRRLLSDRFLKLPDAVDELKVALAALAEAQRRTEERVEELAEAQRRTEEALRLTQQEVRALAEAQRRTEERVEELAEAQRRTEQRVDTLSHEVGRLKAVFGATVEDEAAGVVREVLLEKGYTPLQEAVSLAWDGEVDVVFPVQSPDGQKIWVLIEAKARLSSSDVTRWARRVRSAEWQQALEQDGIAGPYLVYVHGIRIDMAAKKEAERQGIGLLHGQGELISPAGLIYPEA